MLFLGRIDPECVCVCDADEDYDPVGDTSADLSSCKEEEGQDNGITTTSTSGLVERETVAVDLATGLSHTQPETDMLVPSIFIRQHT